MQPARRPVPAQRRRAVVILAVLVIVVILALLAYRYQDLMDQQYRSAKNVSRAAQTSALARAGVNYTAMLLSNPQAFANLLNNNPFDNISLFRKQVVVENTTGYGGQGYFSILAPRHADEQLGDVLRFGVTDECGKINPNALLKIDKKGDILYQMLLQLPSMSSSTAAAMVDWVDNDNEVRQGGAENATYLAKDPPYRAKNGPLDSLDEFLQVEGVTPELLYGGDLNRNGMIDADEKVIDNDNPLGWQAYLTVWSREQNIDSIFQPRIYLNGGTLPELQTQVNAALSPELATYILLYRAYGPATESSSTSSGDTTSKQSSGNNSSGKSDGGGKSNGGGKSDGGGGKSGSGSDKSTDKPSTDTAPKEATPVVATSLPAEVDLSKPKKTTKISSLYSLIDTKVKVPAKDPKEPTKVFLSPLNTASGLEQFLPELLEKTTAKKDKEFPARINLLSAPEIVVRALANIPARGGSSSSQPTTPTTGQAGASGNTTDTKSNQGSTAKTILTSSEAEAILAARPQPGASDYYNMLYQTPAWLITQAKLKPTTVQSLEKYITTRSQVFKFQVVGYFDTPGPVTRVEAVVDLNAGRPRILLFRDLSHLGKGFDLNQLK